MYSIVIPLYNKEKYIKTTVESVLSQSYMDFELIIVNDGSTDKSLDIVESIKDNRVKVYTKNNSGVSDTRNFGVDKSKYDYIAFLDADDTWENDFLFYINKLKEKYENLNVYFSDYYQGKNMIRNENSKIENIYLDDYFKYALNNRGICSSCVVVKKEVLKKVGMFPKSLSSGEDMYVWTKIALEGAMAKTTYLGAFYNRNPKDSLTRIRISPEKDFSNQAVEFLEENMHKAINRESFKNYMSNIIISKSKFMIDENKTKEARKFLLKYITKYNYKRVIRNYIFSLLPKRIRNKIY